MSTVSLEEFLKPISQALGRTEPPASIEPCEATKAPLPGDYLDYSTEELAQWFTEEATKMGTIVREAKPEEVSQVVLNLVNEIGQGGHIVYSDVPEIDGFGIPEVLNNASFEAVRWNPTSREKSMGRAESADIGITFASAGIAETATIMQRCAEKSGRAVCLLPIGHIALLRKSTIFPYMTQLMDDWEKRIAGGEEMPSNVTFISGPSNTADIELVRVVGVHGPVYASVVLIDD